MNRKLSGYASIDKPWQNKRILKKNIPSIEMTLYNFMYECNKNNLDDVAIIYDPIIDMPATKITYRQLFKKIDDCAKSYLLLGVKKGDIVTVSLPSYVENIVSFYALNKIGAITNQIHPLVSQDELELYLTESESKILVGYGDIIEKVKKLKYKELTKVILVDPTDEISLKNKIHFIKNALKNKDLLLLKTIFSGQNFDNNLYIKWHEFIKLGHKYQGSVEINHDYRSVAVLTHTSGTSGKSKAVMTDSIGFNYSVAAALRSTELFQRHDKEFLALPPFPLYILNNVVHFDMCSGIELIVVPKVLYKNISIYFKKHQINHLKGIPHIMESIICDVGFTDESLTQLKLLIFGGGRLTKEDEINLFLKEHGCKYNIANGYGMSEAGGCVTCMFDNTSITGTVGSPLIGSNIKIMSLDGKEEIKYTSNENGEIWLSTPAIMKGYYKNEKATEEVLVIDNEGNQWIRTGDLGRITETGELVVIGRIKRMTFIFDSETNTASKVSHDYIETTLCENSMVEDCVVVAIDDAKTQKALKAYVVIKQPYFDNVITDLDNLCKIRFRKNVSPVEYDVINYIPKNSAGKNDYKYVEDFDSGKIIESKIKILYRKKISER